MIAVAVVAAVAVAFFGLGGDEALRDTERLRAFLTENGPLGPLLYVGSMWLVQPLGLPGFVWMVPAGLIWSWPLAVLLSWIGNLGASAVGFAFARWVARDWIAERIPPRMQAWDRRLEDGGTVPVVLLRVVFGQLAPADWLLAVTAVRWPAFWVGTAIGIVPGILFFVIAGSGFFTWVADRGPLEWTLGLAALAGAILVRRRRLHEA